MKISVILPIYNAEPYLSRCIESLLQQTIQDFELLCIDDGSTDLSREIVKQYQKRDSRILLFAQKNQGVSVARNTGIDHAVGEYLAFVDADDWVEPDYLEWLYNTAVQKKVKLVICGHDIVTNGKPVLEQGKESGFLSQKNALEIALRQTGYQGYLWNKLFHRSLFLDKEIRCHPDIALLEDLLCVCECIMQVSQIYYEPVVKYHYNQTVGSTHQFSEKSVTMFQASCQLIRLFQDSGYRRQCQMAKSWHCQSAGAAYLFYAERGDWQNAAFYQQEQKRYRKEYVQCHQKHPKQQLRGYLIAYFPKVAIWLKKARTRLKQGSK